MNSHDMSMKSTMARSPREEAELCLRVASALKTSAVRKALETEALWSAPKIVISFCFILSFYGFKHLFTFLMF